MFLSADFHDAAQTLGVSCNRKHLSALDVL
jgi:hypothetical protein